MGMMIDNCIKDLLIQREDFTYELPSAEIDFMIDTIRKYQKIREIINIYDTTDISYKDTLQDIREVLEDGKID